MSDNSGCSSDSDCPSERPTCEDKKCINKSKQCKLIHALYYYKLKNLQMCDVIVLQFE